jgi:CRP-like cAMP-binding protein
MANPLAMRMEQFTSFEPSERARLDQLLAYPIRTYARGEDILREGQKVHHIHLILSGLAARTKVLPDGDRQIMAFLIPGDLCDVEVFVLEAMDHNITALCETTSVVIPAHVIEDLLSEFSKLTKALWWSTMVDSAVLREWIVDHGRRDAREHLAHLCYEMLIRYRIVSAATDDTFPFPITQEDLADATGMTPVHANRMLQQLRSEGLIELRGKSLTVLDAARLKEVAKYESGYLHLIRTERHDKEVSDRAGDLVSSESLVGNMLHKVKSALKTR